MTGAIIPTDWDGVSFNCQKVVWPASVQWRAILFGQFTEPHYSSFWDEDTGDVDDAVQAVKDAEKLTEPEFWTEDCDVQSGHPVSAFLAYPTSAQVLTPGTWNTVRWASLEWDLNNPGFDLAANGHIPGPEGHVGIWHYDIQLNVQPPASYYAMRVRINETGLILARFDHLTTYPRISLDHYWEIGSNKMEVQVHADNFATVQAGRSETMFNGHFLGEVD